MGSDATMTSQVDGPPDRQCWSCEAAIATADRFCRSCGATVIATTRPREVRKKRGRRHAAIMLLLGAAIVVFALVHRNPADIILVGAFALPLCGAGAVTWRMA